MDDDARRRQRYKRSADAEIEDANTFEHVRTQIPTVERVTEQVNLLPVCTENCTGSVPGYLVSLVITEQIRFCLPLVDVL